MSSLLSANLASLLGLIVGLAFIAYGIIQFGRSIDNKWSVTHVQVILWTGVIIGSYLALSFAAGSFLQNIPTNTLVLIGIASGTLAFTSITNGLQNGSGTTTTPAPPAGATPPPGDFMDGFLATEKDPSKPSLVKAQMFAWNIVAMLLFVTFVGSNLYKGNYTMPDVGATLSTIIGISNGVHVATKPVDK